MASGFAPAARADDVLHVGTPSLDRPTLVAHGVQLLISGDDDHDASVAVKYRVKGTAAWHDGPPLFRVRPESVAGRTVPEQFAGSVFDLRPDTNYELELDAVDPDGGNATLILTGRTRAIPSDPVAPHAKSANDAATLKSALAAAAPGDVITVANGTYAGLFRIDASGTATAPIVIRGASQDKVILDGGGCTGCNVLEVYGSFVHVENLTLAHASRALRFQGQGSEGNVVRRVHTLDTTLGFGSNAGQKDYYLCDNDLEGRLKWPAVYADDGGAHSNDDGIHVEGNGHVICHNRLVGFGDAMKTEEDGARAVDFYGNEVLSAYDNGVELDASEGNVRCFRNRFTNTYATISFQPIFGGPAYAVRNVIVNVANEQMKFHALGGTVPEEPSGVLVYHNTFVSAGTALADHTSDTSHHFVIENNLFVTAPAADGRTLDWTSPIDDGTFDYDGYYPDGIFDYSFVGSGYQKVTSFAMARSTQPGFEPHGLLLTTPIFASGLTAPADYKGVLDPADVTLAAGSNALDRGLAIPGINDGYQGKGPDLGALERGCALPLYGVRPTATDETNMPIGCAMPDDTDGGASASNGGASASNGGASASNGGRSSSGGAASSSGGATSSGAGGNAGNTASEGGATPAGGTSDADASTDGAAPRQSDSSGCGCRTAPVSSPSPLALLAGAASLLRRRRRARPAR
jgi:MYXO-CTERM domain-containing protein